MLSFLKPKRASTGPHSFTSETEIACPPGDLFAMLDMTGDRYWRRQMGDRVDHVGGRHYLHVDARMPDMDIHIEVIDREPGRLIDIGVVCDPAPGQMASSRECYVIDEIGPGLCRLTLEMSVMLKEELRASAFADEAMMFAVAGFNTVEKIRLYAEEGPDAVRVADGQIVVGMEQPDLH